MKNISRLSAAIFMFFAVTRITAADRLTVTLGNSLKASRIEMVEVDASVVRSRLGTSEFIVTDADGREVASQQTYDGKLIFQAGIPAKGKSVYYIAKGTPSVYDNKVFGRQFPERVDDIAWENDRVAFRCYGPALQKSGERAWGYDVWNKRTSKLVVEERYRNELDPSLSAATRRLRELGHADLADDVYNAVSYHVDHGNGMDCYKVGPTLGCGTSALLVGKNRRIAYPHCYKEFQILDMGPLRFTVRLVYPAENIDGTEVTETRVLSLDAGSQLNKVTVTYDGLERALPIASGIVVHKENPTAFIMNPKDGYMCYEDLGDPTQYKEKYREAQNKDFGSIYVGVVMPQPVSRMYFLEEEGLPGATGHILATVENRTSLTYYFGSGWSRNAETGFDSLLSWEAYLHRFASQVRTPISVRIK